MDEKMIQDEVKYTINKYEKYEYEKEEFITEEFADKVKTEILKIVKNIRIIKLGAMMIQKIIIVFLLQKYFKVFTL